jgi:hypothetical protein
MVNYYNKSCQNKLFNQLTISNDLCCKNIIYDLDKLIRKLEINTINPFEIYQLYISFYQIIKLTEYMKDNKFIGCGDFTVDTKESMDKLLDKEGLKNYTIETLSGTYYRYNKKTDQKSEEVAHDASA